MEAHDNKFMSMICLCLEQIMPRKHFSVTFIGLDPHESYSPVLSRNGLHSIIGLRPQAISPKPYESISTARVTELSGNSVPSKSQDNLLSNADKANGWASEASNASLYDASDDDEPIGNPHYSPSQSSMQSCNNKSNDTNRETRPRQGSR